MEDLIINIPKIQFKGRNELRDELRKFFKEGTIAFEHGYKQPVFTSNHTEFSVAYIDDKGMMSCRTTNVENPLTFKKSVYSFRKAQLIKIINVINDYYRYCKYEA